MPPRPAFSRHSTSPAGLCNSGLGTAAGPPAACSPDAPLRHGRRCAPAEPRGARGYFFALSLITVQRSSIQSRMIAIEGRQRGHRQRIPLKLPHVAKAVPCSKPAHGFFESEPAFTFRRFGAISASSKFILKTASYVPPESQQHRPIDRAYPRSYRRQFPTRYRRLR